MWDDEKRDPGTPGDPESSKRPDSRDEITPGGEDIQESLTGAIEPGPVDSEPFGGEQSSMAFSAKVVGIFLDPARVFSSLEKKPDWLGPFIIMIAAAVLFSFLAFDSVFELAMEQSHDRLNDALAKGQVTEEQMDAQMKAVGAYFKPVTFMIQSVIGVVIMAVVTALLLLFFGNIVFGGDHKFAHYWSVTTWVGLVGALGMIITSVIANSTGDFIGAQLSLAFAAEPDTKLFNILSQFSLFTIWQMILYGVGLSVFTGKSRQMAIAMVLGVFVVITVGAHLIF